MKEIHKAPSPLLPVPLRFHIPLSSLLRFLPLFVNLLLSFSFLIIQTNRRTKIETNTSNKDTPLVMHVTDPNSAGTEIEKERKFVRYL